jgi:hypothetical protein
VNTTSYCVIAIAAPSLIGPVNSGKSSNFGGAFQAADMIPDLLLNRKVWGLTIGFAAYGYSFYLFLTWLPNYLEQSMHMSIMKSAGHTGTHDRSHGGGTGRKTLKGVRCLLSEFFTIRCIVSMRSPIMRMI